MYSVFQLFRKPEEWTSGNGQILINWGIFNPNGPTLYCLGLRETYTQGEDEVFFRWQHFLGGQDYCLGYVNPASKSFKYDFEEILRKALNPEPGNPLCKSPLITCIPSVVLPWVDDEWTHLLRDAFATAPAIIEADWGRELYLLKKYNEKLFDRAGEETRETYETLKLEAEKNDEINNEALQMMLLMHEHIPTFANWSANQYQSRPIKDGDFNYWWKIVTNQNFWIPAEYQFRQAWEGAINRVTNTDLEVKTAMNEIQSFYRYYKFPWWGEA